MNYLSIINWLSIFNQLIINSLSIDYQFSINWLLLLILSLPTNSLTHQQALQIPKNPTKSPPHKYLQIHTNPHPTNLINFINLINLMNLMNLMNNFIQLNGITSFFIKTNSTWLLGFLAMNDNSKNIQNYLHKN